MTARKSAAKKDGPKLPAPNLGTFEGEDVLVARVAIKQAGDGLSKALAVHPALLHRGDVVYVVLECKVDKISFGPLKAGKDEDDLDAVARVHDLKTLGATLVDEKLVREALDETVQAIEKAAGVRRLPFGAEDPDAPDSED